MPADSVWHCCPAVACDSVDRSRAALGNILLVQHGASRLELECRTHHSRSKLHDDVEASASDAPAQRNTTAASTASDAPVRRNITAARIGLTQPNVGQKLPETSMDGHNSCKHNCYICTGPLPAFMPGIDVCWLVCIAQKNMGLQTCCCSA